MVFKMAVPPKVQQNNLSISQDSNDIFQKLGLVSGSIKKTPRGVTISGVNEENKAITAHFANSSGYVEQRLTAFHGTPADRRSAAKELRRTGLSQTAIAERLGVSQKTISDDLKK